MIWQAVFDFKALLASQKIVIPNQQKINKKKSDNKW